MNVVEKKTYGIILRNIVKGSFVDEFAVEVARKKIVEKDCKEAYEIFKTIDRDKLSSDCQMNFVKVRNQLLVRGYLSSKT